MAQNGVAERDDLRVVAIRIAPNNLASELMEFSISSVLRVLISIGASILVKKKVRNIHSKLYSQNLKHDYSERLSQRLM